MMKHIKYIYFVGKELKVYLEPSQTSDGAFSRKWLTAFSRQLFSQEVPSNMFSWVLNRSLRKIRS